MKKQLLSVLTMLIFGFGYAQTPINPWSTSTSTSNKMTLNSGISTTNFKTFALNLDALKESLKSVNERGKTTNRKTTIIKFPSPDGTIESFKVVEASVLHPDLVAKYPGIKSYAGQGIDDPTATIRFSLSDQRGFHGMILSGNKGMSYIDPDAFSRNSYNVYARRDLGNMISEFECLTEDNIKLPSLSDRTDVQKTNDKKLRKYRLALACTAEYGNHFAGSGTDAQKRANILAAMNVTMTRVNGVYERDLAITMEIIANNDAIIYFGSTSSDPWSGEYNSKTQQTIDANIGDANYDIGHLFVKAGNNGNAGCIGCVCTSGSKGSAFTSRTTPSGDPFDIDFVAHEIGHQFGGYHTMNTCSRSGSGATEVEPASGSSIMGYAGICSSNVQNNSDAHFAYVNIRDISANVQSGTSSSCAQVINLSNNAPSANAGADYSIPKSTPFILRGQGSDPDGDAITYTWAQNDPERAPGNGSPASTWTVGPMFRARLGSSSPDRYMPQISDVVAGNLTPTWEVVPSVARTMEFSLVVRDNKAGGGQTDDDLMTVTVVNVTPFTMSVPNTAVTWNVGQSQNVTWNVGSTNSAPINCANVNILLSTDGGLTYPVTLLSNTPNDGSATITVPNNVSSNCRIMVAAADNIFYDISDTNFSIAGAVACNATIPTGLAASGITSSGANLNWNAVSGASYSYRYRATGTSSWTTNSSSGNAASLSGLSAATQYEAQVRSECPSSNSAYNSSVSFTTSSAPSGCSGGISSFPYSESFESSLGAWTQSSSDDINWTRDANGTPSNSTGPSSATDGSYYMYTESSGNGTGYPNKVAILNGPCFDLSGQSAASFSFSYHMYGATMGTLDLQASSNGGISWTSIWSKSGDQGNSWQTVSVDLASYTGGSMQLRYVGTTGSSWRSDLTIDKLSLTTGTPPAGSNLTLTLVFDNYPEETSWTLKNSGGSTVASGGTYGSQADGSTLVIPITGLADGCYDFTINDSYGDGMCCSYGNGSYTLTNDNGGATVASGGSFSSSQNTNFCLNSSSRSESIVNTSRTVEIETSVDLIYPNPVSSYLNVRIPAGTQSMKVYSVTGREMNNVRVDQKGIEVSNLNPGVYLVFIQTEKGIVKKKFVKK